ncbi:ATP-binding protein [Paenibacillus sp. 19GGS1-52]|uniref:AAA family ATPase n=1 Tax=Paenibacillus sp. 19GGS1-52 TaxID=2758563 RepID=UPI001EFBEF64|nr:AAA family ATPase [Paenibacillus sp. 19GGS1-52]ULO04828.1 ATP-binding protein [Paenibacillus sp. 19GGS1-52]
MRIISSKDVPADLNEPYIHLRLDGWNDWWEYQCLYHVSYCTKYDHVFLGSVKVGEKGLQPDDNKILIPSIPNDCTQLPDQFYSLGQDVTYYYNLYKFKEDDRLIILKCLNDIALDESIYDVIRFEYMFTRALKRDVSISSIRGQYSRLAHGNAELTKYDFIYNLPNNENKIYMHIQVDPTQIPSTNLHVLIGRNGVGKTTLLTNLVATVLTNSDEYGEIIVTEDTKQEVLFANLITVAFSAFDTGNYVKFKSSDTLKYISIGMLKELEKSGVDLDEKITEINFIPKTLDDLKKEFVDSLLSIINNGKSSRWIDAITTLDSDPIFSAIGVKYFIKNEYISRAHLYFEKLSSGHKIVLLTITKLVETVEEKSLVILDEPEMHLHPPLLSSFTRALSDLMISRNAVAIIATHSPVILQEIPKECVWIINRYYDQINFDRPEDETFAENIGVLTRDVFGLEVHKSGFHGLISKAVSEFDNYDDIINYFNGKLGFEGKTIARSLLFSKEERN